MSLTAEALHAGGAAGAAESTTFSVREEGGAGSVRPEVAPSDDAVFGSDANDKMPPAKWRKIDAGDQRDAELHARVGGRVAAPPTEDQLKKDEREIKVQAALLAREEAFRSIGKPLRGSKDKGAWGRRGEPRTKK